jgi:hypothetical protein
MCIVNNGNGASPRMHRFAVGDSVQLVSAYFEGAVFNPTVYAQPLPPRQLQRLSALRSSRFHLEGEMKGASKPKRVQKKQAQKTLKEKRSEKRAAAKKGFGTS